VGANAIQAGGAYLRFFVDRGDFDNGMNEVERRINAFSSRMAGMGATWSLMGAAMMAPVMLGVKEYATLEQYMLSIRASLRDNVADAEKSVRRLHDLAVKIGVETEFDAKQVAAAMEKLAIGDLNDAGIELAIRPVIDYAAIAKIAPEMAADLVYQIMQSQKMKPEQIPAIVDMMATASRLSTKPSSELAYAQSTSGGLLHTLGVPLEEQLAVQSILMRMMSGERAGTGLRSAALSLLSPSGPAKKAMEAAKVEFSDGNGNFSLIKMIQSFEKQTEGWSKVAKGKLLGDVFDNRQVEILADILGMSEEVIKLTDRLRSRGTGSQIAGEKREGVAFALDVVNSTLDTLRINFGEALRDDVMFIANKFSELLSWFAMFIRTNPNVARGFATIAATVTTIGASMIAVAFGARLLGMAIASVHVVLGMLLSGLRVGLFLFMLPFNAIAYGVQLITFLMSVIGGVITIMPAFVAGFMAALPYLIAWGATIGVLVAGLYLMGGSLSGLASGFGAFFGGLYESLSTTMEMVLDVLLEGRVADAAATFWVGIKLAFYEGIQGVLEECIGLGEFITVFFRELLVQMTVWQRSAGWILQMMNPASVGTAAAYDANTQAMVDGIRMGTPDNLLNMSIDGKVKELKKKRAEAAKLTYGIQPWDEWGKEFMEKNKDIPLDSRASGQGAGTAGGAPAADFNFEKQLGSLGKYELGRAGGDNLLVDLFSPRSSSAMEKLTTAAQQTADNTASLKNVQVLGVMPT
jgi:TP901 family phage tail tape measure protein